MSTIAKRRTALLAAAAVTIGAGLTVHAFLPGVFGSLTGDALYAVLVYTLVAALVPAVRSAVTAAVAFALCAAVELFQLTGVPSQLAAAIPGTELVLGTTFQAVDLIAYAAGALAAGALDALSRIRGGTRQECRP